jgi:hypothetical protein
MVIRVLKSYILHHLKADVKLGYYIPVLLFTAGLMYVNYRFNLEDDVLDGMHGFNKFFGYFILYATGYYVTLVIYSITNNRYTFWSLNGFWIKSLFALVILAWDGSVPFLWPWVQRVFAPPLHLWMYKVSVNLISFLIVFLPIILFYQFAEKDDKTVYGLNPKSFNYKPYVLLLLVVLPLVVAASFHPSFIRQYPMYKTSSAHLYLQVPEWVTVAGYETAYALDFITVELFFRGFMILGLASLLGRSTILPMAVTYCLLHFGKPAAEAASSMVGGYILGVLAFETRSIWGGIIVHIGLAWMMELAAFFQKW